MLGGALRQWPILLIWICCEKHVMRGKRQALDLCREAHDMGRKTTRHGGMGGGGGAGLWPQKTTGQGIWISVEQNRITGNQTAITFKLISAVVCALKFCDKTFIMKFSAQILSAGLHAKGQLPHTPFHMPNAQAFNMPDQSK